ncbi:MAG: CDP-alcohol phosphatidyltransferase family protein [Patescibacteria group bacterium]|nr:CDP-alcohol phosphatidyltransferase family protein [Patescibacteria group bacterium]
MLEENKKIFEEAIKKSDQYFSLVRLSPNIITLGSLIFAIFSFISLIKNNLWLAGFSFLLAALLDWLDGKIARATKRVTRLGAYLDTIIDRYVEGLVLLGFLFLSLPKFILPATIWVFLALFGSLLTTYSKSARKEKGLSAQKSKFSLAGRGERIILIALSMFLGILNLRLTTYLIFALAIISNFSAFQRIFLTIKKYL